MTALRLATMAITFVAVTLIGLAQPPAPGITAAPALNGAQIVTLSGGTPGVILRYTLDGSAPTASSPQYFAPFLVASNLTVKTAAIISGQPGAVASKSFTPNIPANTLVWSDEFNDAADHGARPDPSIWSYDTGHSGFGNREFEHYCAYADAAEPCDPAHPNAFVGNDGFLHIVASQPTPGVYTSARLKSQGLFSAFHGRIEARMKLPEGQGLWPAFWTLGNNIATDGWPASGEQDIMEHINAPQPDWIAGSLHGTSGDSTRHYIDSPTQPFHAGDWHTYGILWSKGKVSFYVDSPFNIYATFTPADFAHPGAVWPFDSGNGFYLLLNLAVGGNWPGSPNATTQFPAEMLVDYVRIYTN